eukprot:367029-Pleurochrysis_carterae.AAC.1
MQIRHTQIRRATRTKDTALNHICSRSRRKRVGAVFNRYNNGLASFARAGDLRGSHGWAGVEHTA